VIGASAGGIPALVEIARGLPVDLPAALLVVVHTSPDGSRFLPEILSRAGSLPAAYAVDGEPFRCGRFYVAQPDHHLLLDRDVMRVTRGPRENGFRPAVDSLFRTASEHGARVIGVILSGALDDGTYGLGLIAKRGGVAIVQDADEAVIPGMPLSAIQNVPVDHILRAADIPPVIARLARERGGGGERPMPNRREPGDVAVHGGHGLEHEAPPGALSPFTCSECGGALWESASENILRFRCHVGHAFTAESVEAGQRNGLEVVMWTALRALEESAALQRRLAERARDRGLGGLETLHRRRAGDAEERADVIRTLLTEHEANAAPVAGTAAQHAPGRRGRPARRFARRR